MRVTIMLVLLGLAAVIAPARAQITSLSDELLAGTVNSAYAGDCWVDYGPSAFKRDFSKARNPAIISINQITYSAGSYSNSTAYILSGAAQMTFSGPTTGNISFLVANGTNPPTDYKAPFIDYRQYYHPNEHLLNINFEIGVSGCELPISVVYRF